MKQYIFTEQERKETRRAVITLIGKDAHRKMVARKWCLRNLERSAK